MFRFCSFFLALMVVFTWCCVAVGVTLESILIDTSCNWENNIQNINPYELQIDIMSSDPSVKAVRIYTPSGSIIPMLDLSAYGNDWEYHSPYNYATLSDLQAQYKPGTWTVQFFGRRGDNHRQRIAGL